MNGSSKWWRGYWLLVLGLFACAHEEGLQRDGPVVKDLTFEGTDAVDSDEVESRILTEETSWWNPFAEKKRFEASIWRQDLKRIERFYQAQGYHQATVVEADVNPVGEDAVRLEVKVSEGEPTRISELQLQGLEGLPPDMRQVVQRNIKLAPGDVFLEEPWATVPERIRASLVNFGFAEAEVQAEAKVDLALQTAALFIRVQPGARYRVGSIEVHQQPTSKIEPWRVREQAAQALDGFKYYSEELRTEIQQRIFDMGVFGSVEVRPGKGDPQTGTLPLEIDVSDAPFHEIAYGFGLGFEQRRQEGHLVAEYSDRYFLGRPRTLRLRGAAGWAFLPSIYAVTRGSETVLDSGPVARLEAELEQPRLFHPDLRLNNRLEVEKAIEQAFAYYGGKARVGLPWRPRTWIIIEPSYNLELYRRSGGTLSLEDEDAPELLFGCDDLCILSFLEARFIYDRRDDPQEPKKGVYFGLALQQGGGPFGGSFDYVRILPEARGYKSFLANRRLTVGARIRVGSLIPLGGKPDVATPIVARFFSGGDFMRGFSAQRLSPMRLARIENATGPFNAEQVPIGGNGLFETSVETRYQLGGPLTLATFVDTGFVTTEHVPRGGFRWIADNLLWAVGAGVRYRTPVGPVRLDLAYRLPFGPPLQIHPEDRGEGLNYAPPSGCFGFGTASRSYGGAPEGLCSIHLSIGEAF